MKIAQGGRQPGVSETFLYIEDALAVLQEMRCCGMTQGVNSDGAVEAGPHQGVLEDDIDIAWFDGLRDKVPSMGLEHKVIAWVLLLENAQQCK